jgi:hypothetical protein
MKMGKDPPTPGLFITSLSTCQSLASTLRARWIEGTGLE